MISIDTNILFPACDRSAAFHEMAVRFLSGISRHQGVCICEQVLIELYGLLRNPTVNRHPLSAVKAHETIQTFRENPNWKIVDVIQDGNHMNEFWQRAADPHFPYRRIFDLRLAMTLRQHQVDEFVTRNLKDFQDFGFKKVWDPFAGTAPGTGGQAL